jgi:plastocyanin
MKKGIAAVVVVVIVAIAAWYIFGNKNSNNSSLYGNNNGSSATQTPANTNNSSNNSSSSQPEATTKVTIANMSFSPDQITVDKGATVTWTNNDSTAHTVTSDTGTELSSDNIQPGSDYTHTFNQAGTYKYHCSIHPYMTGSVIVK